MAATKAKVGRPSKFNPAQLEQVRKLCLLGATDKELADFFEVSEQTINNWKSQFPKFLESIKSGKSQADAEVSQSLYNKALAGDTIACIFWLKNRRGKQWMDKQTHEGELTINTLVVRTDPKSEQPRPALKPEFEE